jgi:site-specific recombinase XerD
MNLPTNLENSIKELTRAARADNTLRAYSSDMRVFADWARARGFDPLRPSPSLVSGFLADQVSSVSVATIARRVAAIVHFCKATKLESPIDDSVREVLKGIRRSRGTAPTHAKAPLTVELIRAMVSKIEVAPLLDHLSFAPLDLLYGLRDRALILVGFAAALRRSEIAALNVEDLEYVRDGLLLHIRHSKTDQESSSQVIAIVPGSIGFCPIVALKTWLEAGLISSGAVFVAIHDRGRTTRLSDHAIARIIKRRALAADINPEAVSGHSLRSGFVTSASLAGANLLKVAQVTRHTNLKSVQRYFKADLFESHPAKGLL